MIKKIFLAGIAALTLAACDPTTPINNGVQGSGIISASEMADVSGIRFRHVDAINALRASRGLGQLSYSQALNSAAETHARDMALQQRAWHFGSDRSNPQSRAARSGFGGRVLGENIAEAFDGDIIILQNWLDDSTGAKLILDRSATSIGFGWFQEPTGKIWWVQLFGTSGRPGTS